MFIFADEGGGIAELQDGVVHAACSSHERIGLPRRCRQAACASRTAWKTSESAVHAATATSPRSGRATSIDANRITMFGLRRAVMRRKSESSFSHTWMCITYHCRNAPSNRRRSTRSEEHTSKHQYI